MVGHASFPFDRLCLQIGVARQLALCGRAGPARKLCSGLFLEELPSLLRDPAMLQMFVETLLLLQMSALLPRVLQAICGTEVEIVCVGSGKSRRWTLSFGNSLVLLIAPPGPWLPPELREAQSSIWARRILETAAHEMVPAAPLLEAV